ncbi:hypothetical protein LEP1GSC066_1037 [Leptospira sp. serovar Kenya str. Sh9]|nr:hypothetical protein LEP1GSC066_1037 [Leptospira sp. serovar Kenya str. Sh9]
MRSKDSIEKAIRFFEEEIAKQEHLIKYNPRSRMENEMARDRMEIMKAQKDSLIWVLSDNSDIKINNKYLDFHNWLKLF